MTYQKRAGLSAFDPHVQCNTFVVAFNAAPLCCKNGANLYDLSFYLNFATDRNMKKMALMITIECCERS